MKTLFLEIEAKEPFTAFSPLDGLTIWGAYDAPKIKLNDYWDKEGYRHIVFKYPNDDEIRDVKLLLSLKEQPQNDPT